MIFSLPGQLKGPETRVVMQQAVKLRKILEESISRIESDCYSELTIILRIDGSLGSFGPAGVDNIHIEDSGIVCDLVIEDNDWSGLSEIMIYDLVKERVLLAIELCLGHYKVKCDVHELRTSH